VNNVTYFILLIAAAVYLPLYSIALTALLFSPFELLMIVI